MATMRDRRWKKVDGRKVRTSYDGNRPYIVQWREYPRGPQKTQSFKRSTDAREFLDGLQHSLRAGSYVDPGAGRLLFGDWWDSWRPHRVDLRASTNARDESYYRNHIKPTFAKVPLGAVDRKLLREWVAGLVEHGLAPKTVRHAFGLVGQALEAAVGDRRIALNPAAGFKDLPEVVVHEMVCLTPEQVAALEASIDERYRVWLRTAVGAGLRLGELSALRARRVDLMRRRISVVETVVEVKGRQTFGPPKTRAGRREVPISKGLAALLTDAVAGLGPDELVFPAPGGGVIRASLFRRRIFQPAMVAAGLGKMVDVEVERADGTKRTRQTYIGPRIHDLRHTAVSWWIASDADVKQIATWAGHSSVATVLDRYGHLLPGREEGVMDALDALADVPAPAAKLHRLTTG